MKAEFVTQLFNNPDVGLDICPNIERRFINLFRSIPDEKVLFYIENEDIPWTNLDDMLSYIGAIDFFIGEDIQLCGYYELDAFFTKSLYINLFDLDYNLREQYHIEQLESGFTQYSVKTIDENGNSIQVLYFSNFDKPYINEDGPDEDQKKLTK